MKNLKTTLNDILLNDEIVDLTLSYSRLSDFDRNGASALLDKTNKESVALKTGTLIDDLLFTSTEEFNNKYYISNYEEPSAMLGSLCKIIISNYTEIPNKEEILKIITLNNFWSNIKKEDLLISKFDNDEFWGYLKEKMLILDKVIISNEDYNKAVKLKEIILTHPFSKNIFNNELEHIYQYSFTTKIKYFLFRGIIDIISIDHKNKIVYFKDFKTGAGNSSEFASSFLKYRYYLQEAVYTLAFEEVCKKLNLEGYTLGNFEFIYISLKEQIPVSYIVTPKLHNCALNGFKTTSGYKYKGLYELIEEVYFHWKNKVYDLPMDIYLKNGLINLDDSFVNEV